MKKFTLLLSTLLMVSLSVLAQIKMYLHLDDGTRVEYIASRVDSITFDSQIQEPDDEDKPEDEKPDGPVGPKPDPGTPDANGHEYVDLGLPSGVLWATCNIGADSPEDYGDYFAWGETQPKDYYYWDSYKWMTDGMSSWAGVNKYTFADGQTSGVWYNSNGEFIGDNKTILELSDDAANANWGGDWRMPTKEDQDELRTECTWNWTTKNGVNGYTVTGPNGNSIFLPAAGYRFDSDLHGAGYNGNYWSSSLYTDDSNGAYNLFFGSVDVGWYDGSRCNVRSVRPVLRVGFTYDVTFDSNGGEGTMPSIAIDHAEVFSIPENKFTRHGYEFICWNTKADGTGTNYGEGDKFSIGSDITLYAQWYRKETNITHEYVDLGLSVKWATCNVGASSPEETGYFFSWGETKPKAKYNWETYKYKTILELSDDAANANWGGDWRMPTREEQDELRTECTWTWTTQNGVKGYKVTSKTNGNSIFLPAAGYRSGSVLFVAGYYGDYWSSSLSTSGSNGAYRLIFGSDFVDWDRSYRYYGLSVRPVMP